MNHKNGGMSRGGDRNYCYLKGRRNNINSEECGGLVGNMEDVGLYYNYNNTKTKNQKAKKEFNVIGSKLVKTTRLEPHNYN